MGGNCGNEKYTGGYGGGLCRAGALTRLPSVARTRLAVQRFCRDKARRAKLARPDEGVRAYANHYHPTFVPLFCSSSHFFSGAKYSRIAPASASRWPVSASMASGQGLLCPISSILFSFAPASSDPKKVQRLSGPV